MMVVLLIVAIVAAASAPMISKKMMRTTGTGDSPWVFTGNGNNIAYNMAGNANTTAIIGGNRNLPNDLRNSRLYIEVNDRVPQIVFGPPENNIFGRIQINPANNNLFLGHINMPISFGSNNLIIETDGTVSSFGDNSIRSNNLIIGSNLQITQRRSPTGVGVGNMTIVGTANNNDAFMPTIFGRNITIDARDDTDDVGVTYGNVAVGVNLNIRGRIAERNVLIGSVSTLGDTNGQNSRSIGIGNEVTLIGQNSIGIGNGVTLNGQRSIAIGSGASVHNDNNARDNAIAIGNNAAARHANSIAIGTNAYTTAANQIMLGYLQAPDHWASRPSTVVIPGFLRINPQNIMGTNNRQIGVLIDNKFYPLVASGNPVISNLYENEDGTTSADGGVVDGVQTGVLDQRTSDRRLKNVGDKFTGGLEELKKLEIFNYTFKNDEKKSPKVGVMAQDLQKIFPISVTEGDDGYLSIRWDEMFYAAINAIKELDNKITAITEQIKSYFDKVEKLEAQVESQKQTIDELKAQNAEFEKRLKRLEKKL